MQLVSPEASHNGPKIATSHWAPVDTERIQFSAFMESHFIANVNIISRIQSCGHFFAESGLMALLTVACRERTISSGSLQVSVN